MPSSTPKFVIPFPVGTDLISDGDNAIQALAERVEGILGTVGKATLQKNPALVGFRPTGFTLVTGATATLTMAGSGGLVLVRANTDVGSATGFGFIGGRIGTDDSSVALLYDGGVTRAEIPSLALMFAPLGNTSLTYYMSVFTTPTAGINVNSTRWSVYALGGTPTLT